MSFDAAFPIFVFEGNDLSLFGDFNSLVTGLEGIDVEDGVYQAYDSRGRVVGLKAHDGSGTRPKERPALETMEITHDLAYR